MELRKTENIVIAPCTQCGKRFPLAVALPFCIACLRSLRSIISEDTLVRLEKALPAPD